MQIKELHNEWASTVRVEKPVMKIHLPLPLKLSAHLLALKDMYPGRTIEQITIDLLNAAVYELEESLPYKQGTTIISEDEYGDPIYQDIGLTPRFLELTKYHYDKLNKDPEK